MTNYGYIYKTTNLLNNKVYIGQKKGLFTSKYLGSGLILKQAVKKEGKTNFKVEVLVYAKNKKELDFLEIEYIAKYRKRYDLYNLSDGGQGGKIYDINPFLGKSHTKEVKKKISDSHKKLTKTPEHCLNISQAKKGKSNNHKVNCNCGICNHLGERNGMYGRTHTLETKAKMRKNHANVSGKNNPNYGKITSAETKEKIRLKLKGKPLNHKLTCSCCVCKAKRGSVKV